MKRLFDWFVPLSVRGNANLEGRYRGVAQALLAISAVVAALAFSYALLIDRPPLHELALFGACMLVPVLGACLLRATGDFTLTLLLTNTAGVLIAAVWGYLSGGILSPTVPWMLALMSAWAGFGNRRFVISATVIVMACMMILYGLGATGWLPPSMMRTEQLPLYTLLSLLSATALLTVTALLSQVERERVKHRLREARTQAEAANRAKSVFLASMSHKFRTPLNSVIGFAEVLTYVDQDAASDPLTEEQREYVNQIVQAGQQLLALVNQVLDMSQIESGSFVIDWNRVEPATEIQTAVAALTQMAHLREVQLTLKIDAARDCTLYSDAARLRQVLGNLISNAIKFNRAGGSVTVWARRMEPFLRIGVTDTGPGIPTERQATIFQAFAQSGTEAGHVYGAGVGLALSHRIVELLGGNIGFTSDAHDGTTIWIDLPLVTDVPPP